MNRANLLLTIAWTALLASCIVVPSLQPFYMEDQVVFDERLLGEWSGEEGDIVWTFSQRDSLTYTVESIVEEESARFEVHLFRLKDQYYLDFHPEYESEHLFYASHLLPAHSVMQCDIEEDTLVVSPLDYEWVEEAISSGQLNGLQYERVEEDFILSSPTADLQKFIVTHAQDRNVFPEGNVLVRKK